MCGPADTQIEERQPPDLRMRGRCECVAASWSAGAIGRLPRPAAGPRRRGPRLVQRAVADAVARRDITGPPDATPRARTCRASGSYPGRIGLRLSPPLE